MKQIPSYVQDRWITGQGPARALVDPTTEEVIAEASTGGIDFAACVEHARTRGLPALQDMDFAARGALLENVAQALHAHRDELLELSTRSGGNTRGDAKFDVDGAIGTLAHYARLGKEFGPVRHLVDGEGVQTGRSPRAWGEHIHTPRRGVAVHVNAFNFPAWGLFEKAAVAWLAGMPVVAKPATSTCILAQRMVEIVVEQNLLPPGALALLCGSAGDLLDHLGGQDVIAFTGSSKTGALLRAHPCVVERGARINVEADSLNAAVLDPAVEEDSETFDAFVREVVRDMTQKAGQKCTAIRRILVPRERLSAVREALREELARQPVGDPRRKGVKVGPLATADQLRDVRAGVERLAAAAKAVVGDGGRGDLVGEVGERGFFMAPVLFEAQDPRTPAVHADEVFGPVATLLPTSGEPAEISELVALGEGSLVSSIYSDRADFVREVALGIAPYNGRVYVGSAKTAGKSLGPGAVLPQLLHGGPGRAGAGEELGGPRGLAFYMQRTALQGYKPLLEKTIGTAPRV
ncbi:MAG: 3,4-dehydroadipyl-CoA semialdehyde dehydrogenase [Planctomycetota bacterium]|nr:MAG: 3,4-dehydroadipyl-CoA semialdehyde dehydrogenase [Planctomycetota bacterium]